MFPFQLRRRSLAFTFIMAFTALPLVAEEPLFRPDQRIVFVGDSITFAGGYIDLIDAYLAATRPGEQYELINLGLPSETVSGLSEPYHPFPRPDVHERLGRLLTKMKPAVVVACYGMNDGIYHPASEERFTRYQAGIDKLVKRCNEAGAKVILVTPPPFDPLANPKGLVAADANEFGYRDIYKNYDAEVIAPYAKWIVERGGRQDVAAVVDIHTPINKHLAAKRKQDPKYTMSGDGVHVNDDGHSAIAKALMQGLGYKDFQEVKVDEKFLKLVRERQQLLRDAWLSEVGHKRPRVKAGLSLEEAEEKAAGLRKQMDELE